MPRAGAGFHGLLPYYEHTKPKRASTLKRSPGPRLREGNCFVLKQEKGDCKQKSFLCPLEQPQPSTALQYPGGAHQSPGKSLTPWGPGWGFVPCPSPGLCRAPAPSCWALREQMESPCCPGALLHPARPPGTAEGRSQSLLEEKLSSRQRQRQLS